MHPESLFRIAPNWPKIEKMTMTSKFSDMMSSLWFFFFFWRCFISLVKFSNWSKFHVNMKLGSGSGFVLVLNLSVFFYKGLTRNLEIGNNLVWVLFHIWRLGWVRDTKFGTDVSKKILLNAAKCQGNSFYRSSVIKGKSTGGSVTLPPQTQINKVMNDKNWMRKYLFYCFF